MLSNSNKSHFFKYININYLKVMVKFKNNKKYQCSVYKQCPVQGRHEGNDYMIFCRSYEPLNMLKLDCVSNG